MEDLNVKLETVEMIQENIGRLLEDIIIEQDFLDGISSHQDLKSTADKWNLTKLKIICMIKKMII